MLTEKLDNRLSELEKNAKQFWNVSRETGKFLNMLVKLKKAKNILELGTSNGYSTIWLGLAAKENKGKITTIEYYEERIDLAAENFKYCDLEDIISVKQGKVLEVLAQNTESFDFVFIDANKAEYIEYFKTVDKMLSPSGLIVADNITSHQEDVKDYVEYSSSHPDYNTVFIPLGEGLLLNYKL